MRHDSRETSIGGRHVCRDAAMRSYRAARSSTSSVRPLAISIERESVFCSTEAGRTMQFQTQSESDLRQTLLRFADSSANVQRSRRTTTNDRLKPQRIFTWQSDRESGQIHSAPSATLAPSGQPRAPILTLAARLRGHRWLIVASDIRRRRRRRRTCCAVLSFGNSFYLICL